MRKNFTLLCLTLLFLFSANVGVQAQETTLSLDVTTAGTLDALLGANKTTVEKLTLSGNVNGTDIATIRQMALFEVLVDLDMQNTTIVGGGTYNDVYDRPHTTVDNEITPYMFGMLAKLTAITLPKGATKIGEQALFGMHGITSLVVPAGVTELGSGAIGYCQKLQKLTLSKKLALIGQGALGSNAALTEIYALNPEPAATADAYVFSGIKMDKCTLYVPIGSKTKYTGRVVWMKFTNVEESAPEKPAELAKTVNVATAGTLATLLTADEMENVTDLTLTGNINGTDVKTFRAMENLFTIDLSGARIVAGGDVYYDDWIIGECRTANDEVTANMFRDLTKLTAVKLPASINKIGDYAFYGCSALTAIAIPDAVTAIGEYAFTQCASIASYTLGGNITSIGSYAFANNKLMTYFDVPSSVNTLGRAAFSGNTALVRLTTGENVTDLPASLASGCTSLIDLRLGKNITIMRDNVFNGCTALSVVKLPDSLLETESAVFRDCTGLKKVTIGSSIQKLEAGTFFDCTALEEIHCRNAAPAAVKFNTFVNVPVATCVLYVPMGAKAAYETTETWKDFLIVKEEVISGITSNEATSLSAKGVAGAIEISVEEPTSVSIYTLQGVRVDQSLVNGVETIDANAGIYVVKAGKETVKVIVK